MPAKVLMFQGTSSHVGKSVMTAAFCRLLSRRGFRVAPFKGMNMSNNASVTRDGGEMATAQAVQAKACGIDPSIQMNPVLLKTMSDQTCQVIVLGKAIGVVPAGDLAQLRATLIEAIDTSLREMIHRYDFLVIEGAGSPAEVNLKETDLANMWVARQAGAWVILVADIERGGVFAQLIGTLELLEPEERDLVRGFIINKFRGDPALLDPGLDWLEKRTGKPVLGVVPFLPDLRIPEEDSLAEGGLQREILAYARTRRSSSKSLIEDLDPRRGLPPTPIGGGDDIRIDVIRYPTIANFTDLDPIHQEPDVRIRYLRAPPANGDPPDLLILPGSKSTLADLSWLRARGLDRYLAECLDKKAEVIGICGGFQMLGGMIYDPSHVESSEAAMPGLGLLPTSTLFLPEKITAQVSGIHLESGEPVRGYEIHAGRIQGAHRGKPVFRLTDRGGAPIDEWDGCRIPERTVWGTYLHGLFDAPGFRRCFLSRFRRHPSNPQSSTDNLQSLDPYDEWANWLRGHLRLEKIADAIPWMPGI